MSKEQSGKSKGITGICPQRPHWRFEVLQIWSNACDLAVDFHRIADGLDRRRLYRYAEQLRAAGLSLPNNIAEGSRQKAQRKHHLRDRPLKSIVPAIPTIEDQSAH